MSSIMRRIFATKSEKQISISRVWARKAQRTWFQRRISALDLQQGEGILEFASAYEFGSTLASDERIPKSSTGPAWRRRPAVVGSERAIWKDFGEPFATDGSPLDAVSRDRAPRLRRQHLRRICLSKARPQCGRSLCSLACNSSSTKVPKVVAICVF